MANLIEVGRLATTEEVSHRDGIWVYPYAMLITFSGPDELQAALQARKVEFTVFASEIPPEAI